MNISKFQIVTFIFLFVSFSISEEDPGPLRSDSEGKIGGTKVSRTFSYLKSKMSKKNKVGF